MRKGARKCWRWIWYMDMSNDDDDLIANGLFVMVVQMFAVRSVSSQIFLVGNIHVLYNPNRGDIKLGQVRLFLESAQRLSQEWGDIPVVLAGDLNSMPQPLNNIRTNPTIQIIVQRATSSSIPLLGLQWKKALSMETSTSNHQTCQARRFKLTLRDLCLSTLIECYLIGKTLNQLKSELGMFISSSYGVRGSIDLVNTYVALLTSRLTGATREIGDTGAIHGSSNTIGVRDTPEERERKGEKEGRKIENFNQNHQDRQTGSNHSPGAAVTTKQQPNSGNKLYQATIITIVGRLGNELS
ncbi:hypothetical protein RND71_039709 [Anisodus tanguticus]|uniref:Endonuclease/exonuclease/phosphatase domain-containing protein n=1 Tax=Anisodus tanguticus TaxID=243964 RepID=A0AAE1QXW2_9SOLA|nr:hypothetical protein RND71_039709 [Anisodus tanguticus]